MHLQAKMLEERKAFKRQNDLERHRVMESMAKMRKNPGSAIKGLQFISCIRS
jgi:hypothetical protein